MTSQQIADELRPHVRGDIHIDALTQRLYSTDASPFQIMPAAVFVPRDEDDLRTAVQFAFEHGVPIAPRGAGTGLAGESLTSGIVLDLSTHFRAIVEIDNDTVRVQPGVTLRQLNDALRPRGRRFAPDPTNAETITLGGMIATNASGGNAFRHGYTARHVAALKILTDAGETQIVRRQGSGDEARATLKPAAFAELQTIHRTLIDAHRPRLRFQRGVYQLHGDLVDLLVGSEGTLAITTEATLATLPLAACASYALGFATLDDALAAGLRLRDHEGMTGADLLDQRLLARAPKDVLPLPPDVTAALLVTLEADDATTALARAVASFDEVRGSFAAEVLAEPSTGERTARFRRTVVSGFYALPGARRPAALIEDIGVPPERLPQFIGTATEILRDANLTASFLTHVLTGTVHCRPLVDLTDPTDQAAAWPIANRLYEVALGLDGTISAQHGIGLARTPWIEQQFGPMLPVYREVKRIFDPRNILNPGKIVGPDPSRPAWPFRTVSRSRLAGSSKTDSHLALGKKSSTTLTTPAAPSPSPEPQTRFALMTSEEFEATLRKCNACGDCRVRTPPERMCPMFRMLGIEAAAPRGMVNALHVVLEKPSRLADDDVKAVAKHCIHCTRCRDECPASVDIPALMVEAKAAHYRRHGFGRGEYIIGRSERLAALAGTFAFSANLLLGWKPARWALEKLIGLDRRRMLHRFTHRTYLRKRLVRRLFRRDIRGTGRKIAYFVDTFANYNDPLIAEATVAVLEHHGLSVHVPQRQRGSGMPALSVGDLDSARAAAEYNVRSFAELVRDGYTVVGSEPTAVLALRTEYPRLLGTDDARLVADHTVELTALLAELDRAGDLKSAVRSLPLSVGHHAPCHLKSLGPVVSPALLERIAGLRVHAIDVGCSGAAGVWGLSRRHFDSALAIGQPVFEAMAPHAIAASECSACRLQIQQGTGKRAFHPIQLLALGYGLLPGLERRLVRPLRMRLTG